jgi:hypothetical protein
MASAAGPDANPLSPTSTTPTSTTGSSGGGKNFVDFLFEGNAPKPTTLTSSTSLQLPEWYTQYVTDMLGRAQAVGGLPYTPYGGPRIAPFTETERAGFETIKKGAGAYKPFLTQSGEALSKAGEMTGMGAAAGDLSRAASMSGAGAAQPFFGKATDMSAVGAAKPYFETGMSAIERGGAGSSVAAAQPYLSSAAQRFPSAVAEYMNPYISGVVERIGDIGARQLREKYLPEVGREFIQAGQFGVGPGSTRMGEFGARALRDVQEAVLGEQAKALQAGYGEAAEIFGRDVDRAAALAGTVGKLSADDYARLLESGVRIGDIGARVGQLTSDDASKLLEIGKATGTLTAQDAEMLARIGETKGKLSLEDSRNLQELSKRYLETGESAQELGVREGTAVSSVGEKERLMNQKNLDLAYQDFLTQQGYPAEQVKFLSSLLSNIKLPETQIQKEEKLPTDWEYGTTDFSRLLGGIESIEQLLDLLKGLGKGG